MRLRTASEPESGARPDCRFAERPGMLPLKFFASTPQHSRKVVLQTPQNT
jgi:hypothetical protein